MTSVVKQLSLRELISPPQFLPINTMYEAMMGSEVYGAATNNSDIDIYGWCIPPKNMVFPHLAGEIPDFGTKQPRFNHYQQHGIELPPKTYDISIYNIVKYFQLCMDNNPNMIDSLFVPQNYILHITQVGQMVREARKTFLHRGCWHKFKGYAYSQLHKMRSKQPEGKRKKIVEEFGYDVKFAYHVVRLLNECEQILVHGDLDLQANREHLKAIRSGEVKEEDIYKWAADKELQLEKHYHDDKCPIPLRPPEDKIKELLLRCLEHHYGTLDNAITVPSRSDRILSEIKDLLEVHHI